MASRSASLLGLVFLVLLSFAEAREYLVGGKSDAWAVPASEAESLNKWAESKRFRTGDILVWKYDSAKDSVLYVNKERGDQETTADELGEEHWIHKSPDDRVRDLNLPHLNYVVDHAAFVVSGSRLFFVGGTTFREERDILEHNGILYIDLQQPSDLSWKRCEKWVWKYDSAKDSVLYVNKEDYVNCNVSNPIKQYKDGETKVVLDKAGPFYFISGTKDHCVKGQKLVVVVMSPRTKQSAISPAPSTALDGVTDGPAVAPAPTSSASPFKAGLLVVAALMAALFI